jgi:hypothetical protein
MTEVIEATAGVSQSAAHQMRVENPSQALHGPGQEIGLTDVAKQTLAGIENLQAKFQSTLASTEASSSGLPAGIGPAGEATATEASDPAIRTAERLVAQIEQSTQVQAQLAQFVMASSMSSSLGNNLNMFLRGQ